MRPAVRRMACESEGRRWDCTAHWNIAPFALLEDGTEGSAKGEAGGQICKMVDGQVGGPVNWWMGEWVSG
jgi:hypothetical protein